MHTSENHAESAGLVIEASETVSYRCFPLPGCKSESELKWAIQKIEDFRPNGDDTYPVLTRYTWAEGTTEKKFRAVDYEKYNYSLLK